jgi:hypothetical protein
MQKHRVAAGDGLGRRHGLRSPGVGIDVIVTSSLR